MKKKKENSPAQPPKFYTRFLEHFPEVGEAYQNLGEKVHSAGPLNDRDRALIKLAISGSSGHFSAFKAHIRKARNVGVTKEEIEHLIMLMLPTKGFPAMMAALGALEDQLNSEKGEDQ